MEIKPRRNAGIRRRRFGSASAMVAMAANLQSGTAPTVESGI